MIRQIVSKLFGRSESKKSKKRKLNYEDREDDDDDDTGVDDTGVDDSDPGVDDSSHPAILSTNDDDDDDDERHQRGSNKPEVDDDRELDISVGGDGGNLGVARNVTPTPGPSSSTPPSSSCGRGGSAETIGKSAMSAMLPPKRKKRNRIIEVAEDWCVTDANWKEIQYTWTIKSFSKCQDELGNYVTSPEFPSAASSNPTVSLPFSFGLHGEEDLAFYLKVHLKGESEDSDHLAVYIVCKGPEEVLASFELSIIVNAKKCNLRDSKKVCQFAEDHHPAWGFKKFIQFDELQNAEKGFLEGDCLTLHCEVKYVVVKNLRPIHENRGEAIFQAESRVEEGMERLDVEQLWRDRNTHGDVTIICQDHEIPANRVLLATRSEVFRAMFSHQTLEAESGRIEITDVEAGVFEQMLAYIYTGFAPQVDTIAEELLIAANKYALEELKTDCVRVLESKLSQENVLHMLVVGDQHEAASLKEASFAFLVKRLDVFMDKNFKVLWQKFKESHPDLTTETVKVLLERQPVAKFP